jgi:hypothetical protein
VGKVDRAAATADVEHAPRFIGQGLPDLVAITELAALELLAHTREHHLGGFDADVRGEQDLFYLGRDLRADFAFATEQRFQAAEETFIATGTREPATNAVELAWRGRGDGCADRLDAFRFGRSGWCRQLADSRHCRVASCRRRG